MLAPNPGPFTGPGTNSYVVATPREAVILDPGPMIPDHIEAIVRSLGDREARAVLVTHHHPDHAPAANPLGRRLDVPVMGFEAGPDFSPDITLSDGDEVSLGEITLMALHTPGHTADHLCYLVDEVLFTGDHIMGGSTVVIEDAAAYMTSLDKVLAAEPRHLYPGHGPDIPDAAGAVRQYIAHRKMRERQVIDAIAGGAATVDEIVLAVYADVEPSLHFAAAMQVDTMLAKLAQEGRVVFGSDEPRRVVLEEGSGR